MAKKLSNLFFSTIRRAARIQRKALKHASTPLLTKPRKPARKTAATRTRVHGSKKPAHATARSMGRGIWTNLIHKGDAVRPEILARLAYSLYRPKDRPLAGLPLVVMLHGCQQTAQDMALGTRMNHLADQKGFVVLYPQQSKLVQPMRCWRWFHPDARRGLSEADTIADLTRVMVRKYRLDAARVYIAGLSAGAGMAGLAVLRHSGLFAAAALHSGVVIGASHNAANGLQTMRHGAATDPLELISPLITGGQKFQGVPVMIIHGKRDRVVSVRNAFQLAEQFSYLNGAASAKQTVLGQGTHREYVRRDVLKEGRALVRLCVLNEVGHAWSGGDETLKFNSEKGPKASVLIWQFFSMHRRA